MEIPHTVTARPDTGLYNAKLGIWLFLASEVMLFGGLFSAYVFLRLGAEPGYWPMGLLNVPVGTFNTLVLIFSSVTVVMAWAALKMRQFSKYKFYMLLTIICGSGFLLVKVLYEYPEKFHHYGVFIKKDKWAKYEDYLGNTYLAEKGHEPRVEISGELRSVQVNRADADPDLFDRLVSKRKLRVAETSQDGRLVTFTTDSPGDVEALKAAPGVIINPEEPDPTKRARKSPGVVITKYELRLDAVNADPTNEENAKPRFLPRTKSDKTATIDAEDVHHASAFVPKHSSYFSVYFMITGLHGLHVLGGVIVFIYFWGPGAKLYLQNPEHLANRVECAGLFWHFVDLVWIFAFPIFYLL